MFERELRFFIDNQQQLTAEHAGKVLVIRGEEVVGVYDTVVDAYLEAMKRFEPGTFMIQSCEEGAEAYTVTVNSHNFSAPA